jgi:hypothetical protein
MTKEETKKIPNVLCPFLERECPQGEEVARYCTRLANSENVDENFGGCWVDCIVALRILANSNYPFF